MLSAFLLCTAAVAQNSVSVEGTVVDSATGLGVPDAKVYFGTESGGHYETVTDPGGRFQVLDMQNGEYGCHVEKAGYVPEFSGSLNSALKPVRIAAGNDPVRLDVTLDVYAKLRGRVVGPDGKPVPGASVILTDDKKTGEAGEFAFADIVPGSYILKAVPDGHSHPVQTPGEDRVDFVPTWFPSAAAESSPERVVIRGGDDLSGYEIHLQSSPVYRVRGVVTGEDGKPVTFGSVSSVPEGETGVAFSMAGGTPGRFGPLAYFTVQRSTVSGRPDAPTAQVREGKFEFPSVPRGPRRFTVTARPQIDGDVIIGGVSKAVADLPRMISPAVVSVVVDRDIDDLEIRIPAPFSIAGSIEVPGTPADKTPEAVRNVLVSVANMSPTGPFGERQGNSFRILSVSPGETRVFAPPGVAGGYYLDSITVGGQDVTWKPFNLEGPAHISVVYKPNGGVVTGSVDSADGAVVLLIPQGALDSMDVQYGRMASPNASGTFEIDSLAPGSYYAFAVERFDPAKLARPAAFGKIANGAALVHVTEGAAVSVKPPVIGLDE